QASDADKCARRFAKLQPIGGASKSFNRASSLGGALKDALSSYELAKTVEQIELTIASGGASYDWDMAAIRFQHDGRPASTVYVTATALSKVTPQDAARLGSAFLRDVTVIGRGLICQIAADLNESGKAAGGWASDDGVTAYAGKVAAAAKER